MRNDGTIFCKASSVHERLSSNRLRGGRPSGSFVVDPKRLAVLGNLSTTGIEVNGGPLDPRWDPLNLDGF